MEGKSLDTHELFSEQFPDLSVSKLQAIVDELGEFNTSLDDIIKKMKDNISQFHTHNPESCVEDAHLSNVLQATNSKIVVDFIFFLAQVPQGLCATDLSHLCVLEPTIFGYDKEFFLAVQRLSSINRVTAQTSVLDKLGNMFSSLLQVQTQEIDPLKMSEAFGEFLQIEYEH